MFAIPQHPPWRCSQLKSINMTLTWPYLASPRFASPRLASPARLTYLPACLTPPVLTRTSYLPTYLPPTVATTTTPPPPPPVLRYCCHHHYYTTTTTTTITTAAITITRILKTPSKVQKEVLLLIQLLPLMYYCYCQWKCVCVCVYVCREKCWCTVWAAATTLRKMRSCISSYSSSIIKIWIRTALPPRLLLQL